MIYFNAETVGRLWEEQDFPADIVHDPYQNSVVSRIISLLTKSPSTSVILSGEPGTGKSTIINLVSRELKREGWEVLVAGAIDIIAGQMYTGMLDGQIKNLIDALSEEKNNLWVIPNFLELYYSGKNAQDPSGILDRVLPYIEKSHVTVLAEISSGELEKISKFRPKIKTIMETIRLEHLSENDTLALATKWCKLPKNQEVWNALSENHLREAMTLAKQFLGFRKEPGNFMGFLKLTEAIVEARKNDQTTLKVSSEDFLYSLSSITGLPLSIIDERKKLDIEALRKLFYKKIIGQEEAVEAIVERIAMIKAGFTDSSRPLAVFLFVGPTGTGKTEIAKTLAEFLFDSVDRMIRMDMSEFQTPDSLSRLLGDSSQVSESVSLVDQIRKNPFSVLLLDEFEKANPNVWDLFLQLFEDARLTDLSGNTADFRHAIIIMTSNLGSAIPTEKGIGFVNVQRDFDPDAIHKSLYKTFKPEFINRIDRVIAFKPLSKTTMRQILKNELNKVLQRRGFRQKQWAVEWDESAIEFLLEKGFSPHLGARPIKRAIEQYLLAPLAMTIVTNQFPEGDQFLFIKRSHNSLTADFIDPDAPDLDWKERKKLEAVQSEKVKDLTLKTIAFEPKGIFAEIDFLKTEFEKLFVLTESEVWRKRKEALLLQMSEPDFWSGKNKKKHLSEIEYRDRFEQSVSTLASVMERLLQLRKTHSSFPVELIKQVSERILLMKLSFEAFEQDVSQDSVIKVLYEGQSKTTNEAEGIEFWKKLTQMYLQWAKNRKAVYTIIKQTILTESCEFIMVIEGFAAYQVLEKERGIHVWEATPKTNKVERIKVRVDVRPVPDEIPSKESLDDIVKKIFDSSSSNLTKITRKYRYKPSPLVSDNVAHWRSGRIDKILAGDFDLME